MKIIIQDDFGNTVAEQEFNTDERALSLSLEDGQLSVQPEETPQAVYIGCYH